MIYAEDGGPVYLYNNGSQKLATTSSGIQVTGNIANASGDFTIDTAGNIILDADGAVWKFQDGGTEIFQINSGSQNANLKSAVQDKDIRFQGNDGGSTITALTLDMSEAGRATFNDVIRIPTNLEHDGDADTFFGFPANNNFVITAGNVSRVYGSATETVINEDSANIDFRVESDGDTHALFVDASTNRVGISTSAPPVQFTVGGGDGTAELLLWGSNANSTSSRLIFGGQDPYTSEFIQFRYDSDNNLLQLETDTSFGVGKIVQFDRQYGRVTFNEDSAADADFRVESDANTHALFVDAGTSRVGIGTGSPVASGETTVTIGSRTIVGKTVASQSLFGDNVYYNGSFWTTKETDQWATVRINDGSLRFHTGQTSHTAGTNLTAMDSTSMRLFLSDSTAVFNDVSQNTDFRVESDSKTHMLFVDAGTNAVGINSSNPGESNKSFGSTSVTTNFHVESDSEVNGPLFTYDGGGVFLAMANDLGSGTRYYISFGDSGSNRYGDITSNGSVMTYGGTSDYRLKTNVQSMSGSIDRVKQLNPVTFDWISSGISTEGFIAHELQAVVPDAATGVRDEVDDNGQPIMQQVDPRHVVPLLTDALKEAIAKIEDLETRLATLEAN